TQALKFVERAIASNPTRYPAATYRNTLGIALYRAGRYDEAVQRLNESIALQKQGGTYRDWLFLAMAHHRLGHADEARRGLDQAGRGPQPTDPQQAAARAQRPGAEGVYGRLFLAEAEALLSSADRKGAPDPKVLEFRFEPVRKTGSSQNSNTGNPIPH